MSQKVLMIAYHFPPVAASSGFLRTLKFAQYLPGYEIKPTVLTVKPTAYEHLNVDNYKLLDDLHGVEVHRCFAKDGARDFSWRGKYFRFLAFPDRWGSWIPNGIFKAYRYIKKNNVDVIWVTYPIVSALVIGYWVKKLTGLPLICDLRDPIWEEETYQDTRHFRWLKRFESKLLEAADSIVFTSPGTIEKYRKRYPDVIANKGKLITNGFDSDNFRVLAQTEQKGTKKIFLHSGIIPVYERNPENFFLALSRLKKKEVLRPENYEFRLRACGYIEQYKKRTKELGIDDLVSFPEGVAYEDAIAEMQSADVLMVFQDKTCNWQIPAKVFEYMCAERPIIGWVDPGSDTAEVLADCSMSDYLASLSDVDGIEEVLFQFVCENNWLIKCKNYGRFERKVLTKDLADLITNLAKP